MAQGSIRGGQNLEFVDTGPSRRLWAECPWDDIGRTVRGVKYEDYFVNFPTAVVATSNISQLYRTWVDTGGTIVQSLTDPLGSAVALLDTTTNDAASIQTGNLASFINPASATPYDVWFECRFSIATITDSCFFGLAAYQAPATAAIITDGDIMADIGLIGFSTLQATPTFLNLTYKKNGTAVQVPITTVATLAAGTIISAGFHYRIANPTSRKITAFANGVMKPTGVTGASIALSTFPAAVPMALTAAIKNFTTTAGAGFTMKWWRVAMVEN
jgi:hypothetical protein